MLNKILNECHQLRSALNRLGILLGWNKDTVQDTPAHVIVNAACKRVIGRHTSIVWRTPAEFDPFDGHVLILIKKNGCISLRQFDGHNIRLPPDCEWTADIVAVVAEWKQAWIS